MEKYLFNKKTYGIVLAISLVVLGISFALKAASGSESEAAQNIVVTEYSAAQVMALVSERGGENFVLINDPAGVQMDGEDASLYSQNKMIEMLYTASHLSATGQVTDPGTDAEYGFDKPSARVTLLLNDETVRLEIGKTSEVLGVTYVRSDAAEGIFYVDALTGSILSQKKESLRDLRLFPELNDETMASLTGIRVESKDGGYTLALVPGENGAGAGYAMVAPVEIMPDWENLANKVIYPLRGFLPEEYISENEPLSKYGLDDPDYRLGLLFGDEVYALSFKEDGEGGYYVSRADGGLICRAGSDMAAFLQNDYMDVIGGNIYSKSVADISLISMTAGDKSYELSIAGEGSSLRGRMEPSGRELSGQELVDFYKGIDSVPAVGYYDDTNNNSIDVTGKPKLTMYITLRDGTVDILEFYETKDRQSLVFLNGKCNFTTYTAVVDELIDRWN